MKPGEPVAPATDDDGDATAATEHDASDATESDAAAANEHDASGPDPRAGWPAFARRYPNDAELGRLVAAFARGNFALVRREALPLAERAASREIAVAARDLRGRIEPSRLASYLLALGVALMLFLYFFYARLRG